jgi:hypothetical protein
VASEPALTAGRTDVPVRHVEHLAVPGLASYYAYMVPRFGNGFFRHETVLGEFGEALSFCIAMYQQILTFL